MPSSSTGSQVDSSCRRPSCPTIPRIPTSIFESRPSLYCECHNPGVMRRLQPSVCTMWTMSSKLVHPASGATLLHHNVIRPLHKRLRLLTSVTAPRVAELPIPNRQLGEKTLGAWQIFYRSSLGGPLCSALRVVSERLYIAIPIHSVESTHCHFPPIIMSDTSQTLSPRPRGDPGPSVRGTLALRNDLALTYDHWQLKRVMLW